MAQFWACIIAYALTAQQSVMFWDSGEFLASSIKLQATHPPGAPLYTIISRIFLLFFQQILLHMQVVYSLLYVVHFTVLFLFHTIVWLGKKLILRYQEDAGSQLMLLFSAFIGSMALSFSDSFWVSSTEAEVYTLSTLFMAAAFWAATKWDEGFQTKGNSKWLILVCYLLGLSIGGSYLKSSHIVSCCDGSSASKVFF